MSSAPDPETMKAIVTRRYGSPDVLRLEDVPRPTIGDDGVLVRVRAASVNAYDWHVLRGRPHLVRLGDGLRRPSQSILGIDVAGVVEAVGRDVTALRPGDEVFGTRAGSFAELVAGRERNFAPKPRGLTFEEAAAVPVAATTALQGLRDRGGLRAGETVLVNGAGGGVGSFAVQIARAMGAAVTGVTRTANLELVRSLGAGHVIDHGREDVTRGDERFDLILDPGGNHPLRALRRILTPDGRLVLVGPGRGDWVGPIARPVAAVVLTRLGGPRLVPFLATNRREDLLTLTELIEAGKVRPVIDRAYPLHEAAEAIRHVEQGGARGKVVLTV